MGELIRASFGQSESSITEDHWLTTGVEKIIITELTEIDDCSAAADIVTFRQLAQGMNKYCPTSEVIS